MGALFSCIGVGVCLVIEIIMLVCAVSISWSRPELGSGVVFQGSCERVKILSFALAFPVNIISTVIIGTSNYVVRIANSLCLVR